MPFEKFLAAYQCTEDRTPGPPVEIPGIAGELVNKIVAQLGGKTFQEGLFRILRGDEVVMATQAAWEMFPDHAKRILVFGYDWLGRQFVVDIDRVENGLPQVLFLEIGTGDALEVPCDPITFINNELVDYPEETLAKSFFQEWKAENPAALAHNECVGFKVPLFLGGEEEIDNLEVSDLAVYWHLCGELLSQIDDLDDGTDIGEISID